MRAGRIAHVTAWVLAAAAGTGVFLLYRWRVEERDAAAVNGQAPLAVLLILQDMANHLEAAGIPVVRTEKLNGTSDTHADEIKIAWHTSMTLQAPPDAASLAARRAFTELPAYAASQWIYVSRAEPAGNGATLEIVVHFTLPR